MSVTVMSRVSPTAANTIPSKPNVKNWLCGTNTDVQKCPVLSTAMVSTKSFSVKMSCPVSFSVPYAPADAFATLPLTKI